MAVDYEALATTAQRLIEANGRACTFSRLGRDPSDATKPWRGPTTNSGAADPPITVGGVKAVLVPISNSFLKSTWVNNENPGEIARRPQCALIVAHDSFVTALDPDPVPDITTLDSVNDGTTTWRIMAVSNINPGSTKIIYEMLLEG